MTTLQSAPPAEAPKSGKDFITIPAFPIEGQTILTVVSYNYIPDYVNPFDDENKGAYPAVEFFLGANTENGVGFVKTYPFRYSLHEKAGYTKLYKAATGNAPAPGSKPDDMVGKGLNATVTNVAKTSKKGKAYTISKVSEFSTVHPKLKGEITPVAKLRPALDAILSKQGEATSSNPTDSEDAPF